MLGGWPPGMPEPGVIVGSGLWLGIVPGIPGIPVADMGSGAMSLGTPTGAADGAAWGTTGGVAGMGVTTLLVIPACSCGPPGIIVGGMFSTH